jgi:tetratricopeptide (TPR) repeat protein
MSRLGVLRAQGRLVPLDYAKAKAWFEKAANAGSEEGMVQLGIIYERGLGVPKQTDRARELYLKAVQGGDLRAVDYLARVVSAEAFATGRYDEALLRVREVSSEAERAEKAKTGKPGTLTSRALANEAWYAVLANDGASAFSAASRALELNPKLLAASANKAHALLLLGRIDDAKRMYLEHKGRPGPIINGKTWDELIAADFATMRKRGVNSAAIAQMEAALGVGGQQ